LLLFGLLKNINSLLKLFSLSGFVVGYMFMVLCIKLDSHFDFIVSLLGLWFLFFSWASTAFFFLLGLLASAMFQLLDIIDTLFFFAYFTVDG
jgi:hypothetical protein